MNKAKLDTIKKKYDELTELIAKPEIIADNKEWTKLSRNIRRSSRSLRLTLGSPTPKRKSRI